MHAEKETYNTLIQKEKLLCLFCCYSACYNIFDNTCFKEKK